MNDGFIKVGAASPVLRVSDPAFNCDRIIEMMRSGAEKGVKILVFPELSITGYTAQDLFFQKSLRKSATEGLERIVKASSSLSSLAIRLSIRESSTIQLLPSRAVISLLLSRRRIFHHMVSSMRQGGSRHLLRRMQGLRFLEMLSRSGGR